MGLFKPAANQQAFLKAGFLGFQGSGKTYTAVDLAIGLCKYIKGKRGVAMLDSETGSDWAVPRFAAAHIPFSAAKSRAFADLCPAIAEAEKNADVLIIDSISHFWIELMEAYCRKHNIGGRISFKHWMPIKAEWRHFSDAFVNSALHIIVCGRAGWEYDMEEDDEGKKDLIKTGTKMRAEGEFGFEPHLLVEMARLRETKVVDGKDVGKVGAVVIHRAYVLKDRCMDGKSLDGAIFDNPTFKDFLPHVEALNLAGVQVGFEKRSSDDYLESPDYSVSENRRLVEVQLEEIAETCKLVWPSQSGDDKRMKVLVLDHLFGTKSWKAVERMPLMRLQNAIKKLRRLEGAGTPLGDAQAVFALLDEREPLPISDEELSVFTKPGVPEGGEANAVSQPIPAPESPEDQERAVLLGKLGALAAQDSARFGELLDLLDITTEQVQQAPLSVLADAVKEMEG